MDACLFLAKEDIGKGQIVQRNKQKRKGKWEVIINGKLAIYLLSSAFNLTESIE
jgi:hypothetical protein